MSNATQSSGDAGWTDDVIRRLRVLWAEGHSTAEIGRRLGVSKNAVVGKAHRLQLPQRPSPFQCGTGTRHGTAPHRTRGPTLPPLPARPCRQPLSERRVWGRTSSERRPAPPATAAVPPPKLDGKPCCWPLGEPGRPGFRFCGERAVQGKPYCPEHDDRAYVRPRVPRPDPVLGDGFDPYA